MKSVDQTVHLIPSTPPPPHTPHTHPPPLEYHKKTDRLSILGYKVRLKQGSIQKLFVSMYLPLYYLHFLFKIINLERGGGVYFTSLSSFWSWPLSGEGGGGGPTFNGQCPLKNMGIVSRRPLIKVPIVNPRSYCTRSLVKVK